MRRGTTPTLTLTVSNEDGSACDLTDSDIYVTLHLSGDDPENDLTKRETDMTVETVEDATVLSMPLTQAETLAWPEGGTLEVQMRCKDGNGYAQATNITDISVERILKDGEI